MIPAILGISVFLTGVVAMSMGYLTGRFMGRQEMLNRLLDAKDSEAWNYAHFLRADIRAERRRPAQDAVAVLKRAAAQHAADADTDELPQVDVRKGYAVVRKG